MNTTDLVHYVSTGERPRPTTARLAPTPSYHELVTPLRIGILRARQFLLSHERADGSWLAQVAGDASLASQWIFLLAYRGEEHSELAERAARSILDAQLPTGGWSRTPGGDVDLSISVQAYFALKLAGYEPGDERISKSRSAIRALGGADFADTATRFFLALFGQIDYECCPAIAPELLLFHHRQRRRLAPLSVLWSHRPVRDVGLAYGIRELFLNKPGDWPATLSQRLAASLCNQLERRGWTPLRRRALDLAETTLIQSVESDQLKHLSFPDLVWTLIARDTLGHGTAAVPFDACEDRLRELIVFEDRADRAWPKLRTTPLADTALALRAVTASGIHLSELVGLGVASWLRYPDRHRTATGPIESAAVLGLIRLVDDDPADGGSLPPNLHIQDCSATAPSARLAALRRRAIHAANQLIPQLLELQNRDGGWGPAAIGPSASAPDVTGAVLEALSADAIEPGRGHRRAAMVGPRSGEPVKQAVARATAYLRRAQRADGSWTSATGVELVHGTSLAVCGLLAAGAPVEDDHVAAGINWLLVHQERCGGWGELPSASSNRDAADFKSRRATATQTAWGLVALVAAGLAGEQPARRAVRFLLDSQDDEGHWLDPHFTLRDPSTGRFCRNDLHSVAWPLLALSRWAMAAAADSDADRQWSLRLVGAAE